MNKQRVCGLCVSLCLSLVPFAVQACTLYAAAGKNYVKGGGTLIAKNRDYLALGSQSLELVKPAKGFKYYSLFGAVGDKTKFSVAGVNEKGLYVANSAASNLPKELAAKRKKFRSKEGMNATEYMLRNCFSVDDALSKGEALQEPQNFIMADRNKIAFVEVLPDHTHVVRTKNAGVLYHTNHYVTPEGLPFNFTTGKSSFIRYCRISELLGETAKPYTLQDFIRFGEDRNYGTDTSIYRMGNGPKTPQTLASFVVHIPTLGNPEIYVKYRANPDEQGREKVVGPEVYTF